MRFTTAIATATVAIGLAAIGFDLAVAAPAVTNNLFERSGGYVAPVRWETYLNGDARGEPINVVISNRSDSLILATPRDWLASMGFVPSNCNLFADPIALADLNEFDERIQGELYREKDASADFTTCDEVVNGGLRLWVFSTPDHPENGLFIQATREDARANPKSFVQYPTDNGYTEGRAGIAAKTLSSTVSPFTRIRYFYHDADEIQPSYSFANMLPEKPTQPVKFDGGAILFTVRFE